MGGNNLDIVILCPHYYDLQGKRKIIGGVETYIGTLASMLHKEDFRVSIFQRADENFQITEDGVLIRGVAARGGSTVLRYCEKLFDVSSSLLIFASDSQIQKTKFLHTLAIQHGIGWDHSDDLILSTAKSYAMLIKSFLRCMRDYSRLRLCKNMVCVDCNFVNWHRSITTHNRTKFFVIPNFASVPSTELPVRNNEVIDIVFARRFVLKRGTRIFCGAVARLMDKYPAVTVTLAGEGAEKNWMQNRLSGFGDRVKFTEYRPEESVAFHQNFSIAVVPTTASEGTSLSCLEAMAAGCAVVTTNVGGLTQIIIDRYNGLMVSPNENELYDALEELICDEQLRTKLAARGYETAKEAFSYELWKERWLSVVDEVMR